MSIKVPYVGTDRNVWDDGRWATITRVTFDFMTRYIIEHILSCGPVKGKSILELGAGTGRLSYLLLKQGASKVTLVDSSRKAIGLSKELFKDEPAEAFSVIESDIFSYTSSHKFDIVFSSGLIEHFRDAQRFEIVRKHVDLCSQHCIILHPTDTLYQRLFSVFPPAVKLYGFAKPYSIDEMDAYLQQIKQVRSSSHRLFYLFYSVPLFHNFGAINRLCDRTLLGRRLGGLNLTHVQVGPNIT